MENEKQLSGPQLDFVKAQRAFQTLSVVEASQTSISLLKNIIEDSGFSSDATNQIQYSIRILDLISSENPQLKETIETAVGQLHDLNKEVRKMSQKYVSDMHDIFSDFVLDVKYKNRSSEETEMNESIKNRKIVLTEEQLERVIKLSVNEQVEGEGGMRAQYDYLINRWRQLSNERDRAERVNPKSGEFYRLKEQAKEALKDAYKVKLENNRNVLNIPKIRQILRKNGVTASTGQTTGIRGFRLPKMNTYNFPDALHDPLALEILVGPQKLEAIRNDFQSEGIQAEFGNLGSGSIGLTKWSSVDVKLASVPGLI